MIGQPVNRLMLYAVAPFLGVMLWITLFASFQIHTRELTSTLATEVSIQDETSRIQSDLVQARTQTIAIAEHLERTMELYTRTANLAGSMYQFAAAQTDKPLLIYDRRITNLLGTPQKHIQSNNIDLKMFPIHEKSYSGYAMKVQLKTDQAMKLVLGYDQIGKGETTSSIVRRYKAVAGVNAGGFADDTKSGKRYPLSTTVLNGNYVMPFEPSYKNLFFVGLNQDRELIGGKFKSKEQLEQLQPLFGVSFVPILLQDGQKQTIPNKWKTTPARAPRTVIANYKHNHLLFLVIDGRDENGSSGATLTELQQKLINLGTVDAYNLDGGGSSTLVIENKVVNSPSDGIQRKLPTHFIFFK